MYKIANFRMVVQVHFQPSVQVAQLVEQRTETPCAGGSNPPSDIGNSLGRYRFSGILPFGEKRNARHVPLRGGTAFVRFSPSCGGWTLVGKSGCSPADHQLRSPLLEPLLRALLRSGSLPKSLLSPFGPLGSMRILRRILGISIRFTDCSDVARGHQREHPGSPVFHGLHGHGSPSSPFHELPVHFHLLHADVGDG